MNWQPTIYCFSFGTLTASVVASVFTPFCRKRQPAPESIFTAAPAAEPALLRPAADKKDKKKDRINYAMRRWTDVRADADLAYVTPPPAPEESEKVTETALEAVIEPRVIELPAASIDAEIQAQPEEEPCAVAEPNPFMDADFHGAPNFYEILQISPRADIDTIHRVYRIMAARFHPDNPVSGDHEMFLRLCEAYEVLSRPERRVLYDFALQARQTEPNPIFGARIFVDGLNGELNRRFGVLALLYQRRRTNQGGLGISTLELEKRMSLPREHLEFTLWYLRSKGFVQVL
ncbi:MAG TPA: DnaJ domain-containing protein, partial [Candidatus Acidoferrum sp.]|nr:DnaJ domain-containing protein [Candidatus Acidoferrum sp.]